MYNSLSDVIIYGSAAEVKQAATQMQNFDYLDEYGYTPLIETAVANDKEKALILLDAGANPNMLDVTSRSALHWACENNNLELVDELLQRGANPNAYSISSEPVLVKPLLRDNIDIKLLLIKHGANLKFAYDYINAKLLGHRFELIGSVDIADPNDIFTEVDYEGFYFEFSLDVIQHSLTDYMQNFAGRSLRHLTDDITVINNALKNASHLSQYDQYLSDVSQHRDSIEKLLKLDPLVIPVSQEGHALTIIKHQNLLAIVDRAQHDSQNDTVPIYYMNHASRLNADLMVELIYKKQQLQTIHQSLPTLLGLQQIAELPIHSQIMGNCSWANVEAVIPVLYLMLSLNQPHPDQDKIITDALELHHRWREWDKNRALHFVMQNFKEARPARKACLAALLAGVVFQRCSADNQQDVMIAKSILSLIKKKQYEYIFESYMQKYVKENNTEAGKNFERLINIFEREEVL